MYVYLLQSGVTPESDNITLSSSGAIDQSSCNGDPSASTITSPEGTALQLNLTETHTRAHLHLFVFCSLPVLFRSSKQQPGQSVMSMASSHSQHSQISTTHSLQCPDPTWLVPRERRPLRPQQRAEHLPTWGWGKTLEAWKQDNLSCSYYFIVLLFYCFIFSCFSPCWYYSIQLIIKQCGSFFLKK